MDHLIIRLILLALWLLLTFNTASKNLKKLSFIRGKSTYSFGYRNIVVTFVYGIYALSNAFFPSLIIGFLSPDLTTPLFLLYIFSLLLMFFVVMSFELNFSKKAQRNYILEYPNERVVSLFALKTITEEIEELEKSKGETTPSNILNLLPHPTHKMAVLLFAQSKHYFKLFYIHTENPGEYKEVEKCRKELSSIMDNIDIKSYNSEHKFIYVNDEKEDVDKLGLYIIPFEEWQSIANKPIISENIWKKEDIVDLLQK